MPTLVDIALAIAAQGYPVFPCNAEKRPITPNGFKDAVTYTDEIRKLFASSAAVLIGVPTGSRSGIDALDLDYRHGAGEWETRYGQMIPATRRHQTMSGGCHFLFRHADGVRNSASRVGPGVDVRGEGGYIIFAGSPGYSVTADYPIADWPAWLLDMAVKVEAPIARPEPISSAVDITDSLERRYRAYIGRILDNVSRASEGAKHDVLFRMARTIGGVMGTAGLGEDHARELLLNALPATVEDWKSAAKTATDGLRAGAKVPFQLEDRQIDGGASVADEMAAWHLDPLGHVAGASIPLPPVPPEEPPPAEPPEEAIPLISEGSVAEDFAAEHAGKLRYCHNTGAWFLWSGTRWKREETKLAYRWAHQLAKIAARQVEKPHAIVTAGKAAFASGVERIAQSDRAFAVTSEIWDTNPWILGTPAGTVDLRTGELNEAVPTDYITRQTAVGPADTPDCPLWLQFLDQACAGDQAFIRFLRQWSGYSLTGSIQEHALLFIFGPGGNGKSVWLNTVSRILGDYCTVAAMDAFVASKSDKHPTDLAMLRGARMVCSSETEEGRLWAEVRIKQLTGGDPITARFMRQDFFTFRPQFKLTVIGNHQPELRNVDDAAKRRFNVGPFIHKPPAPDKKLEDKLKAEWPAILRWMIDGCLDWQQNGLVRPDVVTATTGEYFEDQDLFTQWIDENCLANKHFEDTNSSLWRSWSEFAFNRGHRVGTVKGFSQALKRKGFEKIKDTDSIRGRGFRGIRVRTPDDNHPPQSIPTDRWTDL